VHVGFVGSGTLSITHGGSVSSSTVGYIGYVPGSTGVVTVDGAGSTWTNSGDLYVGNGGNGTLSITGGGAVTVESVSVNGTSLLAIDVGSSSLLAVGGGTGSIYNYGAIRILAGAGVPANTTKYSPISAGTWSGSGTYQALGGTWSAGSHTFTASSVTAGTSSLPLSLNLAAVQRALIDDYGAGATGWEVGASFPAATSTTSITFTASPMSSTTVNVLQSLLHKTVSGAWTFSTTGYTVSSSNPVYVSFKVGPGFPSDDMEIWQYSGSTWAKYDAPDLTYDGTYASFTMNGLRSYAIVPEPGTLALLAAGLLSLLVYARRRQL
jgi:T5SS/PEP-CTERM-associated repeat protein